MLRRWSKASHRAATSASDTQMDRYDKPVRMPDAVAIQVQLAFIGVLSLYSCQLLSAISYQPEAARQQLTADITSAGCALAWCFSSFRSACRIEHMPSEE